ncbi:MAG: hypothetical protein QXU18_00330 [Thermoplasmatales archaeon]
MENEEKNVAREQARLQLDGIVRMVNRLDHATKCDGGENCELSGKEIIEGLGEFYDGGKATGEQREEYHDAERAGEAMDEDPLSIQLRTGWYTPGEREEASEYEILLCTGGPAVRIIGELDKNGQPRRAVLQYQDWHVPWTDYTDMSSEEHADLLSYAKHFNFGE